MTKEEIEQYRHIVKPFLANILRKVNYEGMGEQDETEFCKDFDEILDMAIEALKQEPCEDAISREAAIQIVSGQPSGTHSKKICCAMLKGLPSVHPLDNVHSLGDAKRSGKTYKDLIDRELALRIVNSPRSKQQMIDRLEDAPSKGEPRRKGKWLPCNKQGLFLTELMRRQGAEWYGFKCSECNYIYKGNALTESPYCQKCGAKMEE